MKDYKGDLYAIGRYPQPQFEILIVAYCLSGMYEYRIYTFQKNGALIDSLVVHNEIFTGAGASIRS